MDDTDLHFDLPIKLQDLDSDGFSELFFPATSLLNGKSHLLLVSGRTGAVIGKPFTIASCHKIKKIYKEDVSIGYSCSMDNRSGKCFLSLNYIQLKLFLCFRIER